MSLTLQCYIMQSFAVNTAHLQPAQACWELRSVWRYFLQPRCW